MRDMQILPRLSDSITFLYLEKTVIRRKNNTIEAFDEDGRVPIPVAALSVLMLGPGTSISHAAVNILAKNGCSVCWVGQEMSRFYAAGFGETYKAYKVIQQAELVSDPHKRKQVVIAMYQYRFDQRLDPSYSLPQIRGFEGVRVRKTYQHWSEKTGVHWDGRQYNFQKWGGSPINRALSTANAVLNSLCHAIIVSAGYSPALGFIHQGRQLSFVYDIADLYKTEITIPVAFQAVSEWNEKIESHVRETLREKIRVEKLVQRVLPDINKLLDITQQDDQQPEHIDPEQTHPIPLWDALFSTEPEEVA